MERHTGTYKRLKRKQPRQDEQDTSQNVQGESSPVGIFAFTYQTAHIGHAIFSQR